MGDFQEFVKGEIKSLHPYFGKIFRFLFKNFTKRLVLFSMWCLVILLLDAFSKAPNLDYQKIYLYMMFVISNKLSLVYLSLNEK